MKKLKLILVTIILTSPLQLIAQIDQSVFSATGRGGVSTAFVTDYQCLGVNPANLGIKTPHRFAYGFLEFTSSLSSQALTRQEIRNDILKFPQFSTQQKKDFGQKFAEDGININYDVMAFGASARIPAVGGVAISAKNHFAMNMKLSKDFADILFNGYNASYFDQKVVIGGDTVGIPTNPRSAADIVKGSEVSMLMYNEYAVGFGRGIINLFGLKLMGGISVKYIEGLGILELNSDGDKLNAYAAFSPGFNVNYGSISSPSDLENGGLFQSVGTGYGVDLGFTTELKSKTIVGLAITNIGRLTWKGNVYEVENDTISTLKSAGLSSANLFQSEAFFGDSGIIKWKGVQDKQVGLPSIIRVGVKQELTKHFAFGADVVLPLKDVPGALKNPVVALGADVRFLGLVLSSGMSVGGNNGFNVPIGLTLSPLKGRYEAGIASRDILTFFNENGPTISGAFGFLRFKI